jgi:predicted RNA-binding Zn-ribbon protein involved in translation (DUF1610 family)
MIMQRNWVDAKRKDGTFVQVPVLSMGSMEYYSLENEHAGMCFSCGELMYGVEPDAVRYKCEDCGHNRVFGLEYAVLHGRLNILSENQCEEEGKLHNENI